MPVSAALAKDPVVTGPLGGLALSGVRAASPMMVVRAIRWYRDLARLGLHIPFFMVHDFGLLYAAPKEQLEIGPRPARGRPARHVSQRPRRGLAERCQRARAQHATQR
jgi:hypothetical protein